MAVKNFAVPLDSNSKQTGDITMKELVEAKASATFELSNVTSGGTNRLNLVTSKNGSTTDHIFSATVSNGTGTTTLTGGQLKAVYGNAENGDWDYVKAEWTFGAVDVSGTSNMHEIQNSKTYNFNGWPPSN